MARLVRPQLRPTPWVVCLDLQPDATAANVPADLDGRLAICRRVIAHARAAGWSIVHVLRRFPGSRDNHNLGTAAPFRGLEPAPFETVLFRHGYSAFSNPRFGQLAEAARDEEAITVALSLGPACLLTAIEAHDRGIPMTLVDDTLCAPSLIHFDPETVRDVLFSVALPFVRRVSAAALIQASAGANALNVANQH